MNAFRGAFFNNSCGALRVIVIDSGEKVFDLIGFWSVLLTNLAGDAADLTVLADQRAFVGAVTEYMGRCRERGHLDNAAWTGRDALLATGTLHAVDDRQTFCGNFNGVEGTGAHTGA